jgi:hypothetical protein
MRPHEQGSRVAAWPATVIPAELRAWPQWMN